MLENKKAVIFDLDGTLVDSMWIWREIDIRFLGKYGLEVPQGLNDKLEGYSFHETAVYFKEHFPLPLTIEEIMGTWNRMASEIPQMMIPVVLRSNRLQIDGFTTCNSFSLINP